MKKAIESFFFLTLIFFFSLTTYSQTIIKGSAPTYAGTEIVFKTFSDPFSSLETELGKTRVLADGNFIVTLNVSQTTCIYSYLGVFKGYMYIEPNKQYEIKIPEKTDKVEADVLNPYFEEITFQIPIINLNDKDINFLIRSFDDAYKPYFSKFAGNILVGTKKVVLDSALTFLGNYKNQSANPFFENYVDYKLGILKHFAYQQRSKAISKQYFQSKPILYTNPAYTDLFNQVYNKYLLLFSRTNYGKLILTDINDKRSYSALTATLLKDSVLKNDTLRELVVLKNVYDEFYSTNFSRQGLLNILDSLVVTSKIDRHKNIAQVIRAKMVKLMIGFTPPSFELFDKDGKKYSLESFKGTNVYLNFCSCNSYACIKEFDLLKKLNEKHNERIKIVTIISGETLAEMKEFLSKSDYPWLFLYYGNQPSVITDYDIRAFPTYFLIGSDGKLIYSPAASPSENFEYYLFQALRAKGEL